MKCESLFVTLSAAFEQQTEHSHQACFVLQVDLPSWVNFPDYERVGWVNSIIGEMRTPHGL